MTTGIEWTDETWNPILGCSHASDGCDNCYAERESGGRLSGHKLYEGLTVVTDDGPRFSGKIRLVPERLDQPIRWKRPRRIFVNSMSDLFHSGVPRSFIVDVFAVMAAAPRHQFQILTKRPARMARLLADDLFAADVRAAAAKHVGLGVTVTFPLANVWLGTSIENDDVAWRVKHLAATPAAVRWVSAEPLIGSLGTLELDAVDWVVAGGESGPKARPCHPDWLRDLRDRCLEAEVPFLVKQWGEWAPLGTVAEDTGADDSPRTVRGVRMASDGTTSHRDVLHGEGSVLMLRYGKHVAGRTLDGVVHDEYPLELAQV